VTDDLAVQTFACVWDALMDTPAEAVAMRVRSDLLSAIQETVKGWDVARATAARRLELTRPRLTDLLRGKIDTFDCDDLIQLATRAGLDVRVQIMPVAA